MLLKGARLRSFKHLFVQLVSFGLLGSDDPTCPLELPVGPLLVLFGARSGCHTFFFPTNIRWRLGKKPFGGTHQRPGMEGSL